MKTRDRIIQAALELFNLEGEPNVTTNHIAAHIGISPGNLYYHFRNKEQIIHCIFDEYARDLDLRFQPKEINSVSLDSLMGYLDGTFMLMWRYRFFYANLPDILKRDSELQQKYLVAQESLQLNMMAIMDSFRLSGLVELEDQDLLALTQTLKLVASSWIFYQASHVLGGQITKAIIYQGVLQVLGIMRPLTTEKGKQQVEMLESHYRERIAQESPQA